MTGLKHIISEFAKNKGVDLIGFGSIQRFNDLPLLQNRLQFFPKQNRNRSWLSCCADVSWC